MREELRLSFLTALHALHSSSRAAGVQGAGNIIVTAGRDIIGIENVTDTLPNSSTFLPSGLTGNTGFLRYRPDLRSRHQGHVSGAGIATLQSLPDVPVGDANLIAPRGTVNFGAAGVRVSGNLNVAAFQVLNAFNVQLQGVTTGLPVMQASPVVALTSASNTAAVTQQTVALTQFNNKIWNYLATH